MSDNSPQFGGDIPEAYDTYLGPFLFAFAAKDLSSRIKEKGLTKGEVLEVACGTGILTEHLRTALPEDVHIVATDISEDMLRIAEEKRGDLPNTTYQTADASELPFADNYFDAVVSQFGIMFLPDKQQTLKEWARVLKPGGHMLFNVWDDIEHNKVIAVAMETVTSFFESEPPAFLKMPFSFNDTEHIIGLMQQAGFANCTFDTVNTTITELSAEHMARGLVTGNPTILEIDKRATADAETIIRAEANAIQDTFAEENGNPHVSLQEIVFEGVKQS